MDVASQIIATEDNDESMLANRFGRLIGFSSIASLQGAAYEVDYSAAKGAIDGLVRALAREVAADGITVNAIAPGFFDTGLTDAVSGERLERLRSNAAAGRFGEPEEIGSLAVFLASAEAGYLTGQIISPNGGFQYCAAIDRDAEAARGPSPVTQSG